MVKRWSKRVALPLVVACLSVFGQQARAAQFAIDLTNFCDVFIIDTGAAGNLVWGARAADPVGCEPFNGVGPVNLSFHNPPFVSPGLGLSLGGTFAPVPNQVASVEVNFATSTLCAYFGTAGGPGSAGACDTYTIVPVPAGDVLSSGPPIGQ